MYTADWTQQGQNYTVLHKGWIFWDSIGRNRDHVCIGGTHIQPEARTSAAYRADTDAVCLLYKKWEGRGFRNKMPSMIHRSEGPLTVLSRRSGRRKQRRNKI